MKHKSVAVPAAPAVHRTRESADSRTSTACGSTRRSSKDGGFIGAVPAAQTSTPKNASVQLELVPPREEALPCPTVPEYASDVTREYPTDTRSVELPFDGLLDVPRAAKFLGISVKTLRGHILHRRIEFVRVGGRILFRPDKLLEYIECNTVPARVR